MNKTPLSTTGLVAGLAASAALSLFSSGCATDATVYGRTTGYYRSGGPQTVVYADDYDYYPAYGVYYSRNRHEYVYREGSTWVRRSRPEGVSLDVLLAAPSVRMDFHDEPEHHDAVVVKRYPRNWHRDDKDRRHHGDDHDRRDDHDHDHDNR